MSRRTKRLNELIRAEISELLQRQVKDPRLAGFVTVTEVSITPDLRHAKVFVSVMGSDEEKAEALRGLLAASGFIRRELKERLTLRRIPDLSFERDDSIEHGAHLLQMIKQVSAEAEQKGDGEGER